MCIFLSGSLDQTGGTFIGSGIRSLQGIGYTGSTGTFSTYHDNNQINAASGTIASYFSFRADVAKTGAGTLTDLIGFYADPGGTGGTVTRWYGIFVAEYTHPGTSIGGHFAGAEGAVQVGTGGFTSPTVNGRWFEDGDLVLGGSAMSGTERLRVIGDAIISGTLEVGTVQTYSVSNVTTDRTYDANSTTLDEIADVLGTLIDDLRTIGLVN